MGRVAAHFEHGAALVKASFAVEKVSAPDFGVGVVVDPNTHPGHIQRRRCHEVT